MKKTSAYCLIILFSLLTFCNAEELTKANIKKLNVDMTWHWQLTGKLNTKVDAQLYDIDLFDTDVKTIHELQSSGKTVICYFSAGSYENWRNDKALFNENDLGKPLDGWDGERWLDTHSENVRSIMKKRLDLAQQKGCDGVEPDNIDGFDNLTGLNLSPDSQLNYNRFLAHAAHQRGLLIGLKNNVSQAAKLVNDFDFSINEQCHEYNECADLSVFIKQGKPVFNAEYKKDYVKDAITKKSLCEKAASLKIQTLLLPLELDDSFRQTCN